MRLWAIAGFAVRVAWASELCLEVSVPVPVSSILVGCVGNDPKIVASNARS